METLLNPRFSWLGFGIIALVLIIGYLSIQFLLRLFGKMNTVNRYRASFIKTVQDLILIYEPLAVLILIVLFVFIHPTLHALLLLVVWLVGFRYLRDYVCGRMLRFESNFQMNMRLQTPASKGVIAKIGRFGLSLKTERGLQFINYTELYQQGFTALTSKGIGGVYELALSPTEGAADVSKSMLENLLISTPYIDSMPTPELLPQAVAGHYELRIQVREAAHLYAFVELLKEWGLTATSKK